MCVCVFVYEFCVCLCACVCAHCNRATALGYLPDRKVPTTALTMGTSMSILLRAPLGKIKDIGKQSKGKTREKKSNFELDKLEANA